MTRFARFNVVGVFGFAVQLAVLQLAAGAGVPVPVATLLAVETALVHNFLWHERWTWAGACAGTRAGRLARFHLANGVISLAGNALLTTLLASAGVPLVIANTAAVLACAAANFAAGHFFVFCAKTWPTFHGHLQ